MNGALEFLLTNILGWTSEEIKVNGNRIKAGLAAGAAAAIVRVYVICFHASIPAADLQSVTDFSVWLSNAILAGGGALIAAWTVRAPGVNPATLSAKSKGGVELLQEAINRFLPPAAALDPVAAAVAQANALNQLHQPGPPLAFDHEGNLRAAAPPTIVK